MGMHKRDCRARPRLRSQMGSFGAPPTYPIQCRNRGGNRSHAAANGEPNAYSADSMGLCVSQAQTALYRAVQRARQGTIGREIQRGPPGRPRPTSSGRGVYRRFERVADAYAVCGGLVITHIG